MPAFSLKGKEYFSCSDTLNLFLSDVQVMTASSFLSQVDWSRPWLIPFQDIAAPIVQSSDWRSAMNATAEDQNLRNHRNLPIRFVPQSELPPGVAYESFISETGYVPTRENLHDFFNALVWLSFPAAKARLNALQASEIAAASQAEPASTGNSSRRGKLRDAITIFDENAALLVVSDPSLADALRQHRWQHAFLERREDFGRAGEVRLFGHALMEKLVKPYKAITAHAWTMVVEQDYFTMPLQERLNLLDRRLASQLAAGFTTRALSPLPVLGVPGWWPQQEVSFYLDAAVFRPPRS